MVSRDLNRVQLMGNLTDDPYFKTLPSGSSVISFNVATNRKWMKEGVEQEETTITKVTAWAKLAEICQKLLKKGSKVFCEGRLTTNSWEDSNSQKQYRTEIMLENVIFLSESNE